MKKYWPIVALLAGILVVAGVYFFVIKGGSKTSDNMSEEDQSVAEIPQDQRPSASLIPSMDGHWLKMKIEGIKVQGAASMDYELLYKIADGRTQGVPGTIQLNGQTSIERNLLLGSESAGKYRYDDGVESGTLTLRFRNSSGKLLGRLSTDWTLSMSGKNYTVSMNNFVKDGQTTFTSSSAFTDGKSESKSPKTTVPND